MVRVCLWLALLALASQSSSADELPSPPPKLLLPFGAEHGTEMFQFVARGSRKLQCGNCAPFGEDIWVSIHGMTYFGGRCSDCSDRQFNCECEFCNLNAQVLAGLANTCAYYNTNEGGGYNGSDGAIYAPQSSWAESIKNPLGLRIAAGFLQRWRSGIQLSLDKLSILTVTWKNIYQGTTPGHSFAKHNTFQTALVADDEGKRFGIFAYEELQWPKCKDRDLFYLWVNSKLLLMAYEHSAREPFQSGFNPHSGNGQCTNNQLTNADNLTLETNLLSCPMAQTNGKYALPIKPLTAPASLSVDLKGAQLRHCSITSLMNVLTLDGGNLYQLFNNTMINFARNHWLMISAVSNCSHEQFQVPPFTVELLPIGQSEPLLSPGPVRVKLFFTALGGSRLRSDLTILLYQDGFELQYIEDGQAFRKTLGRDWKCKELCGQAQGNVYFMLQVKRSGLDSWLITSDFGFHVHLVWRQRVEVTVPETIAFKSNLIGLCGNIDGKSSNDAFCPDKNFQSAAEYGSCWQSKSWWSKGSSFRDFGCHDASSIALLEGAPIAESLLGPSFELCKKLINESMPTCYSNASLSLCALDVAESGENAAVICQALVAVAWQCLREDPQASVKGIYDSNACVVSRIAEECSAYSTWKSPAPACERTCADPVADQFCTAFPRPSGCVCDEGFVLHEGGCKPNSDCDIALGPGPEGYQFGDSWLTRDCKTKNTYSGSGATEHTAADCTHGECKMTPAGMVCLCKTNYVWDGAKCTKIGDCSGCGFNGDCVDSKCVCEPGFSGDNCETVMDPCESNPCKNDAKCQPNAGGAYSCDCSDGYGGQSCEIKLNPCDAYLCAHLSKCSTDSGECNCSGTNYTGVHCDELRTSTTTTTSTTSTPGPSTASQSSTPSTPSTSATETPAGASDLAPIIAGTVLAVTLLAASLATFLLCRRRRSRKASQLSSPSTSTSSSPSTGAPRNTVIGEDGIRWIHRPDFGPNYEEFDEPYYPEMGESSSNASSSPPQHFQPPPPPLPTTAMPTRPPDRFAPPRVYPEGPYGGDNVIRIDRDFTVMRVEHAREVGENGGEGSWVPLSQADQTTSAGQTDTHAEENSKDVEESGEEQTEF